MHAMPRILRRSSAIGLALSAYDMWRRLPPQQRRQIAEQVRTHGPRIAAQAAAAVRVARARGSNRREP
jgi:hypothetical protein